MKEKVLFFEVLTQEEAVEIAYNWKYEGILSFYNMTSDLEDLHDFLDKNMRGQNTFSVRTQREKDIIAYFYYDLVDNNTAEIVLGINPIYLHKGYGSEIIQYAEEALHERKAIQKITVAVAKFNTFCIDFYQGLGYASVGKFENYTNGGLYTFLKMEKKL